MEEKKLCHKIKICGLMSEADATYVNEAKADFAGLVFANTRRKVSFEMAKKIRTKLDPKILTVGVFVNHDEAEICQLAEEGIISMIQLHGEETPETAIALKEKTGLPVIKAFRIQSKEDIEKASNYPADYYLFDTYQKGIYGGTGKVFDWNLIEEIGCPFFLAGGLDVQNIEKAMETNAYALDISSGVETDGAKDRDKIMEVVSLVHR